MKKFYPYDPNSTERITETATIEDAIVLLNHIPKKDSIQIDGFNETSSINLTANQFRCDYSLNTQYREANRILHFNSENDGRTISISYIVVGSPILADTMNEIKDHLENSTLHTAGQSNAFIKYKGLWNFGNVNPSNPELYDTYQNAYRDEGTGDFYMWDGSAWRWLNVRLPVAVSEYRSGSELRDKGDIWQESGFEWLKTYDGRTICIEVPMNSATGLIYGDRIESASTTQKGVVKIGDGLKVVNGKLVLALGTTPSTVEGAMWLSV